MKTILGIILISTFLTAQECELYTIEIKDIKIVEGKKKLEYKIHYNENITPKCMKIIKDHYRIKEGPIEKI